PVILSAWSGHGLVLNSAALTALGIPDSIRDPMGGRFDRDAAGRLTGLVEEYANYAVVAPAIGRLIPDSTMVRIVRDRAIGASAMGVTSIQTFLLSMEPERAARVLLAANVPVRVRLVRTPMTGPNGRLGGWEGVTLGPRDTVSGTKYILDGTPVERLAATRAPYTDRPGWHGRLNFGPDTLRVILQEALATGDQPLLHATGDSAVALILSTMHSLAPDTAWRRIRVRVEHGDGATPDLVPHAVRMGVMVVQNPTHFALGGIVPARFGPERAAVYQPLRSLLAAGVPVALGGDGPINPFVNLMFCLVHPNAPDEAITMEQAVTAYTRGAAWAEGREREKGTLTPGKLADLAVLSQDIFAVRPEQLPATTSVLTLLGGQPVHDAGVLTGLR
ncbi:MAG TPA: amidohydrolase family protein, partial [Gemmatimonadales bacterium]